MNIELLVRFGLSFSLLVVGGLSNKIHQSRFLPRKLSSLPILNKYPDKVEIIVKSTIKNLRLFSFILPIFILIDWNVINVISLLIIKYSTELSIIAENILGDIFINFSDNENQRQRRLTFTPAILVIAKWITILISFIFCLYALEIDPTPLLGSIGLIALILGYGARHIINDIYSGLFIIFEDYFRIGDLIDIDGFIGAVKYFSLRSTKIQSRSGETRVYANGLISKFSKKYAILNDIFITYSRIDKDFVSKLHYNLKKAGHDPWIDFEDITPGTSWEAKIIKAIDESTYVVVVVSNNYLKSEQCAREAVYFLARKKTIIPISYTEINMNKVPHWLSSKHFIFFKEDNYEGSFRTLLKAINNFN